MWGLVCFISPKIFLCLKVFMLSSTTSVNERYHASLKKIHWSRQGQKEMKAKLLVSSRGKFETDLSGSELSENMAHPGDGFSTVALATPAPMCWDRMTELLALGMTGPTCSGDQSYTLKLKFQASYKQIDTKCSYMVSLGVWAWFNLGDFKISVFK